MVVSFMKKLPANRVIVLIDPQKVFIYDEYYKNMLAWKNDPRLNVAQYFYNQPMLNIIAFLITKQNRLTQ